MTVSGASRRPPTASSTGDLDRLTQALLELAQNAMKYSDPGSRIGIGSALADGQARLWVHDEGRGIDGEDLDRIFERFSRGQVGQAVDGSGLGLSIVSSIAAAHGGHMTVDSRPGAGSTFTIVLPASTEAGEDHPVDPVTEPAPTLARDEDPAPATSPAP